MNEEKEYLKTLNDMADCISDLRFQVEDHLGFKSTKDLLDEIKEVHIPLDSAKSYLKK